MSKKILHLTYGMGIGGTEQVIRNLIEGSDANLFEMSIFCLEEPIGAFGTIMLEQGTAITSYQRKAGVDFKLLHAIRKHIVLYSIDILHCHQYTPWFYGALAAMGLQTKVIFTEHGRFYPDRSSWKRKVINPMLVNLTDRITAISSATKGALVDFEFIPEHKIEVIYNGIKSLNVTEQETASLKQSLSIDNTTIVLGTIARLDPIKNHTMMLKAFASVLQKHSNMILLIVGDGEERARLEQLASRLEISAKVFFTGYINAPGKYLNCMDIFLLPSLSEGTSMTLLEAMSLAKPCVVTDSGGNPEIVLNEQTGIVTENENETQFADAINLLLSNNALATKMSFLAQQRYSERFSARAMCSSYKSMYQACQEA